VEFAKDESSILSTSNPAGFHNPAFLLRIFMYPNFLKILSKKIESKFSEIETIHNFDNGPEFEIALCKILKELLPNKFGVCRGFIVDKNGDCAGDDIIIYDRLRFPTIRRLNEEDFSRKEQVPFEAVYCYIEAKNNLELDNENDSTLNTALVQIEKIKTLERSDRPLTQITEIFSMGDVFKVSPPTGWSKTLNPLHTAIISRKTSLKKSYLTPEETYPLLENRAISVTGAPDLIVAGEGVVILPTAQIEGLKHIVPFLFLFQESTPNVLKTEHHALAIGLCQILWALSRIELGVMPWEEIIGNGLHNSHLTTQVSS
jgi:hypothetical protein